MRKTLLRILVFALVFSLFTPAVAYAETAFREASVVEYEGTVNVIISGGQKQYDPYKGMGLTQGDTIITSENSWVKIYIDDDKEIKLGENSRLTLSELSEYIDSQSESTGLSLWCGKAWIKIKNKLNIRSKFEIKTGSTVMGVKGTQFYVGNQNGITDVAVLSGTVSATTYYPSSAAGGNPPDREVTFDIHANEMTEFDNDIDRLKDIHIVKVRPESLDLLVLEDIVENPENFDSSLLENIDQVIEDKRTEEEHKDESESAGQNNKESDNQPIYYGRVTVTPIPTSAPTSIPTSTPTPIPTSTPTPIPTSTPTPIPTSTPTPIPTSTPTPIPTSTPTPIPTFTPTPIPTFTPTPIPTSTPTPILTSTPTPIPTSTPTPIPTSTLIPSSTPTPLPSISMDNIGDISILQGESGSVAIVVDPSGAYEYITTSVSESGIVSVGMDGSILYYNGEMPGIITVTVTASLDGYTSVSQQFTITVGELGGEPVDNQSPQLLSGQIPYELTTSGIEGNSFSLDFNEELSSTAQYDVENRIISSAVNLDMTSDLNFKWFYNAEENKYTLTVTNYNEYIIRFKDTIDITVKISDIAGNSSTVTLLKLYPITIAATPDSVHLERGELGYASYTNRLVITLPQDATFYDGLSEYDIANAVTLGGVMQNCTVANISNVDGSTNQAYLYINSVEEGMPYVVETQGTGTITLSKSLWTGDTPLTVSIDFSAKVNDLVVTLSQIGEAALYWSPYNVTETITVYMSETSENEGFFIMTDANVYQEDGYAVIQGLTDGKTYWFKIVVNGSIREGDSNTVSISMSLETISLEDIAGLELFKLSL